MSIRMYIASALRDSNYGIFSPNPSSRAEEGTDILRCVVFSVEVAAKHKLLAGTAFLFFRVEPQISISHFV